MDSDISHGPARVNLDRKAKRNNRNPNIDATTTDAATPSKVRKRKPTSKASADRATTKKESSETPVNVEIQCGVILPDGKPCRRKLTCKSHSMGAKRAVPGRSAPYDQLLAQAMVALTAAKSVTTTGNEVNGEAD